MKSIVSDETILIIQLSKHLIKPTPRQNPSWRALFKFIPNQLAVRPVPNTDSGFKLSFNLA